MLLHCHALPHSLTHSLYWVAALAGHILEALIGALIVLLLLQGSSVGRYRGVHGSAGRRLKERAQHSGVVGGGGAGGS